MGWSFQVDFERQEHFGPVVAAVGHVLLQRGPLRLQELLVYLQDSGKFFFEILIVQKPTVIWKTKSKKFFETATFNCKQLYLERNSFFRPAKCPPSWFFVADRSRLPGPRRDRLSSAAQCHAGDVATSLTEHATSRWELCAGQGRLVFHLTIILKLFEIRNISNFHHLSLFQLEVWTDRVFLFAPKICVSIKKSPAQIYAIEKDEILHRLRFPQYLEYVHVTYGEKAELHGLRLDRCVEHVFFQTGFLSIMLKTELMKLKLLNKWVIRNHLVKNLVGSFKLVHLSWLKLLISLLIKHLSPTLQCHRCQGLRALAGDAEIWTREQEPVAECRWPAVVDLKQRRKTLDTQRRIWYKLILYISLNFYINSYIKVFFFFLNQSSYHLNFKIKSMKISCWSQLEALPLASWQEVAANTPANDMEERHANLCGSGHCERKWSIAHIFWCSLGQAYYFWFLESEGIMIIQLIRGPLANCIK